MNKEHMKGTCQSSLGGKSPLYDIPLVLLFMKTWYHWFVPLGEMFHYMGGALGVVMMTAGACGGWTSVGTELQGEQRDLA